MLTKLPFEQWKHGFYSTYTNRKCRCEACTDAWRLHKKEYTRKRVASGDIRTNRGFSSSGWVRLMDLKKMRNEGVEVTANRFPSGVWKVTGKI